MAERESSARLGAGLPLPEHETDVAGVALAAARRLSDHYGADLAQGRCPWPSLRGGWTAPCAPRVDYTTGGVGVAVLSIAGYAAAAAWQTYRREHRGALGLPDEPPPADAPPQTVGHREAFVWFSWARLGRMHRQALGAVGAPEQLALELVT